jgi:flagellin
VANLDIQGMMEQNVATPAGGGAAVDYNVLGTGGTGLTDASIDTENKAKDSITAIDQAVAAMATKLNTLGSAARQVDSQLTFTSKLSDVIQTGIGVLVDADLAKDSAQLQALQLKQQLGVQALSIANQSPQSIASLFR